VTNLGFVQHLSTKISENELAAKGIKMSVKHDLLQYIKGMNSTVSGSELQAATSSANENNQDSNKSLQDGME
jgi:hypothetical protein